MNLDRTTSLTRTYYILRITYGLVPILAGLDKFVGILADWETYLPAVVANILPLSPALFMKLVGVIEVIAGLTVIAGFTRTGAYVVMAWLSLIAVNLVFAGYLDIAVRDLVMAVGAYSLAQLAAWRGEAWVPSRKTGAYTYGHAN